jgi:hypothetical protein
VPAYLRGKFRDILTFVKVSNQGLYYGFKTKDLSAIAGIGAADVTALGHLAVAALPNTRIAVIGANSPKPPRVRKLLARNPAADQQGSVSTFCGIDNISTALAEEWELSNGGRGVAISNRRTISVGARLSNGGIYIFPMNSVDANAYAEELGLILPGSLSSAERGKAFSGTNKPKPAIVSKALTNGKFTSFCSTDKLDDVLAGSETVTGYSLVKPEVPSPAPSIAEPTNP